MSGAVVEVPADAGRGHEQASSHDGVLCVCPECGRRMARERELGRTRRRWWVAAGACVVMAAAYVTHSVPAYQNGGWVRAVPSTLLIVVAPTGYWTAPTGVARWGVAAPMMGAATGADSALSRALGEEAWRRVMDNTMWEWQAAWFTRRAVEPDRAEWEARVALPARWVVGVPLPMRVVRPSGGEKWPVEIAGEAVTGTRFTHNASVYPVDGPREVGSVFTPPIRFMSRARTVYAAASKHSCVMVGSVKDIFMCDKSAETGEMARTFLNPRLVVEEDGTVSVLANNRNSHPAWSKVRTGLGCRIEVVVEGTVAGVADFAPAWDEPEEWFTTELRVRWATGMRERVARDPCAARLRMTGDLALSYRAYCAWPFDDATPTCWTGSIEFDAPVVTGEADVRETLRKARRVEGR